MKKLKIISRIAEVEFETIVSFTETIGEKLRVQFIDGSFVDAYFSQTIPGRFAFHWERRHLDGTIYRYDNYPDTNWQSVSSFPYHFHDGYQDNVVSSPFPTEIIPAFCEFMNFVKKLLNKS